MSASLSANMRRTTWPLPWRGPRGQRRDREEPALDDLGVGHGQAILLELRDHVDRDMVAAGDVIVEEDAVQHGVAGEIDIPLLLELTPHRLLHGLAEIDA